MSDPRSPQRLPRAHVGTLAAVLTLALVTAYALLGPSLGSSDAHAAGALRPPSAAHPFGTDHFGFDLLARTAEGLRVSLLVGALAAVASTCAGAVIGLVAATWGGTADRVLMRLTDVVNSVPHLILSVVIVALFRGSIPALVLSIAATHWTQVARVVRATVLSARTAEYVAAAYATGADHRWVLTRHLAPAALGQAAIAITLLLPHAIWHESALSFLGLGIQPDRPSLGTLMDIAGDDIMLGAWWTLLFPALALLATTLSVLALAPKRSRAGARTGDIAEAIPA